MKQTKAEKREDKKYKEKHGMKESGRSVKYLTHLAAERSDNLQHHKKKHERENNDIISKKTGKTAGSAHS